MAGDGSALFLTEDFAGSESAAARATIDAARTILASKDLIERLDTADAQATGLDPDAIAYTPLGELDGASDKAIRDAGAIPVTKI